MRVARCYESFSDFCLFTRNGIDPQWIHYGDSKRPDLIRGLMD